MRKCGNCTKCCEGWLHGKAYKHTFYKGKPCFYLKEISCASGGCSIYNDRPYDPCKTYVCAWVNEEFLPMWMKPNLINVICTKINKNNIEYYEFVEAGNKIDATVLNWIVLWAINSKTNILYYIDGGLNYIGSDEFCNLFNGLTGKSDG